MEFAYYSLRDGFNSTLLLVSDSPKPFDFVVAIHSRSGRTVLAPAMTIQPQEKLTVDLASVLRGLGADVTGDFSEGSVAIYFNGTIMPLAGQLTMTNPSKSLSLESETVDNSPGLGLLPKVLNAVWWGLGGGRDARIMVSNTTGNRVTADVFLDGNGERHPASPLMFAPYETKVLSIVEMLGGVELSSAQVPEGGITIIPRGALGGLIAQGKITDAGTGFSTSLNFADPSVQWASALHASGVPIGVPSPDSPFVGTGTFTPHVIVRNLLGTGQTVMVTVEYPGADGPAEMPLAPVALRAYETKDLALDDAYSLLPLPLPYCSIRIQYSGPPGSALAEVSSVESKGDLVIDSRVRNEGDGWAGSGAHPWHLDGETESVLFLTNMGGENARIGFQIQAEGVHFYLTDLRLRPHETRAIDIRKLRDAQKEDFQGNKIPAGASDGSVLWGRLDPRPVMGRLVVLQHHRGVASNYDCDTCNCSDSFTALTVTPTSENILVNHSQQVHAYAWFTGCNGNSYPIDVSLSMQTFWTSGPPSVATVSSGGLVTGHSGGSATISVVFSDYQYMPRYGSPDCDSRPVTLPAYNTCNVCGLSVDSPASGQVSHLGGASFNVSNIPLNAGSACSGTASWTMNYTYTRGSGSSYTSSSSTSSSINSTKNYQPPVGNGGMVDLQAQATLLGSPFQDGTTAYVDGTAIPNGTITARLVSLYSGGASPNLLAHIAAWESGCYCQFNLRSLFGVSGRWPVESYDGGSHVGLMQVPNGMANGFDWVTNTQTGAAIFQQKLSYVQRWVSGQRRGHATLPDLTGIQYEDDALVFYGPYSVELQHFYVPNPDYTGWTLNPNCTHGQGYVSHVRGSTIPG